MMYLAKTRSFRRLNRSRPPTKMELGIFRDLPDHVVNAAYELTDRVLMAEGTELTSEGEPGRQFFILESGTCAISRMGRPLDRVHDNDFVGELSLLDHAPRRARILTTSDCVLHIVERPDFAELRSLHPDIAARIDYAASSRR